MSDYLAREWQPALGCTEPASIAYAAALAAARARGEIRAIRLVCDPRIYKNCYAVGIPHSGHRVGLRWALAIGSLLPDPELELQCFRQIDGPLLARAEALLARDIPRVELDAARESLFIDCRVDGTAGRGRAVIEDAHTRVTRLERDGAPESLQVAGAGGDAADIRGTLAARSFEELIGMARSLDGEDREALRRGIDANLAIARHGLSLFPERFVSLDAGAPLTRINRLVCAGVYARMWGENFTVMSLAGSGNKGIVCSVPLALWGEELGADRGRIEEALALACLLTSSTTHHLGTLSAVCGCSNAAGMGLAAGLVLLQGGGAPEISMAVHNMVGNVTGMICDGAKIGCALKTMTAADAAFRAASLALSGIGIPYTDGIVGRDGRESLLHLGRIATRGMDATDREILSIMQDKLGRER
jgi:L-cysteine desulfidase